VRVCVCVRVCARICVCVYVCVCVFTPHRYASFVPSCCISASWCLVDGACSTTIDLIQDQGVGVTSTARANDPGCISDIRIALLSHPPLPML
jgi:hypothetical protein